MVRRPTYLFLFLLFILPVLAACGPDEQELIREGEEVYINNCSRCHEVDGRGFADLYPPLAGNPIVILHDPNPTIDVVLHGRHAMPGFADILDGEEIAAVITYIRNTWGNDASMVQPRQIQAGG